MAGGGAVEKIKVERDADYDAVFRDAMAAEINKARGGEIRSLQWKASGGPMKAQPKLKRMGWKKTPPLKMAQGGVPNLGPSEEHMMPDPMDSGMARFEPGYDYAGGGWAKAAGAIQKAAHEAGMAKPVTAERDLTTLEDTHTSLGDRVRQGVAEAEKMNLALPGLGLAKQLYEAVRAQGFGRKGKQAVQVERARLGRVEETTLYERRADGTPERVVQLREPLDEAAAPLEQLGQLVHAQLPR